MREERNNRSSYNGSSNYVSRRSANEGEIRWGGRIGRIESRRSVSGKTKISKSEKSESGKFLGGRRQGDTAFLCDGKGVEIHYLGFLASTTEVSNQLGGGEMILDKI